MNFLDRLLDPSKAVVKRVESAGAGAWLQVTEGESRLPVSVAIFVAVALELVVDDRVANRPRWLFVSLAALLLVATIVINPKKINRPSKVLRALTLSLIAVITIANIASGVRLMVDLLNGTGIRDAGQLLLTGGAIWLTNVIVFALWYWEFDRGGPVARAVNPRPHPDFWFPQMSDPEHAPPDWESEFVDYLYLSFTNAMAFSPTDVMPYTRWAKMTMLVQSLVSLLIAVLVIARAVNILK